MNTIIKGIIPPIVTPLKNEYDIDEQGLERLIEYLIEGGVHGIFLLGTTGEATSLSYQTQKNFIEKACAITNKRIPVLVGITDTFAGGSIDIADFSKKAGADALVISSPYYLPITEDEFISYLHYLKPNLKLPFLLYNMPGCTKMHMSLEMVKKAQKAGAIGIKDSSGDLAYLYDLIEEFKDTADFSVFCGTELFAYEAVHFGASGVIAGGANIFPAVFVELYQATLAGNSEKITRLREIIIQIEKNIYNIGTYSSRYIKSIKCALSVMGICNDYVAPPFQHFNEKEHEQITQNIKKLSDTFSEIKSELDTLKIPG